MELGPAVAEAVQGHLATCAACAARDAALLAAHDDVIGRIRGWDAADKRQMLTATHEPLTPSPSGSAPRMLESPLPEGVIPGYDLLGEIHRGGQGVVYRARQRSTKRDVAIKVLLEGPFASRAARRRFEREIELVAGLKHPNIVAVFDSGATTDGRQFCVMDYVDGVRLDQYVRDKRLDARATLALFASICDAVNFAHQRGVIHRDLKPSNILVDTGGQPRVLDFGLAKEVAGENDPLVSVTGQVVGTLPYLSPEQARGTHDQIDVRADVYALGVILYELLTGQYPYPVVGQLADVLRHISDTAPRRPITAWRKESGVRSIQSGRCPLNDEIETIALKALSKEPERRYQSAGELGRDVSRYLAGELIEAKRDSTWYIVRKTMRKRRGTVLVGCIILALLIAWGVTTSYFYAKEKQTAERAQRRFDQVRALAKAFLFDIHDAIADLPGATPARVLLVQNALKYLDNLSGEAGSDVALKRELATAYAKVGDVQGSVRISNIGDTAGAMVSFKKGLALLESIEDDSADQFRVKEGLALMLGRIGDMYWAGADLENSLASYRASYKLGEEMYALKPDSPDAVYMLVARRQDMGDVLHQMGRRDEGTREYQAGLDLIEPLAVKPDAPADLVSLCAINYGRVAEVALHDGRTDDALDLFRRSLRLRETQAKANPGSVRYRVFHANALHELGNTLLQMARPDEAKPYVEQSRDIRKALVDADADDARAQFELSVSLDLMADVYLSKNDFDAALAEQKASLALREVIASKDPSNLWYGDSVAVSHDSMGESLYRMERYAEAEQEFRKGLEIRDKLIEQSPADLSLHAKQGTTLTFLGNTLWKLINLEAAHKALDQALTVRMEALAASPNDTTAMLPEIAVRDRIGDLLMHEKRLEEATQVFERCHAAATRAVEIDPGLRPTRRCLAVAELKLGLVKSLSAEASKLGREHQIETVRIAVAHLQECHRLIQKMRDDGLINSNDKSLIDDAASGFKEASSLLAEWTGTSPFALPQAASTQPDNGKSLAVEFEN